MLKDQVKVSWKSKQHICMALYHFSAAVTCHIHFNCSATGLAKSTAMCPPATCPMSCCWSQIALAWAPGLLTLVPLGQMDYRVAWWGRQERQKSRAWELQSASSLPGTWEYCFFVYFKNSIKKKKSLPFFKFWIINVKKSGNSYTFLCWLLST